MRHWLRVVLPSSAYFAILGVLYGLGMTGILYLEHEFGQPLPPLRQYLSGVLILAAAGYALYRVFSFHPIANPGYRNWLATTPWTARKPLPWPVHLVPQDAVIVAIFCAMCWSIRPLSILVLFQAFLTAYLLGLVVTHFATGEWLCGYAAAFGLAAAVWQWQNATASLVLLVLTYLIGFLGLRRSLERFPWEASWQDTIREKIKAGSIGYSLGWPFGRLAPEAPNEGMRIPWPHAVLVSLLCGWWLFALLALVPEGEDRAQAATAPALVAIFFAPVIRTVIYCDGYWPPISLAGRLGTGRWLIPGYDQVFVAPLLAGALGLMILWACRFFGGDLLYGGPAAVTISSLILLGMGPTLKAWRLTGNHRIVEGTQRNNALRVG
jgi:hypothetical protein